MFGRNLLVCPFVHPLFTDEKIVKTDEMSGWDRSSNNGQGDWKPVDWTQEKKYEVYLPSGTQWYDFWTGELLEGGRTLQADAQISRSP